MVKFLMRYALLFVLVSAFAAPGLGQVRTTKPRVIPAGPAIGIQGEIRKPGFTLAPRKIERTPVSFLSPRRDFRQAVLSSVAHL